MHAVGKQKQVKDFVVSGYRKVPRKSEDDEPLPGLSREHFYEICSVLLQRAYELLAPEMGLSILEFLAAKNLITMFRDELRRQERVEHPTWSLAQKNEFYYGLYILLGRFDARQIDSALLEHCRKMYGSTTPHKRRAQLLFDLIDIPILIKTRVNKVVGHREPDLKIDEKLLHYELTIARDGDDICRYHLAVAWAYYEQFLNNNPTAAEKRFAQAVEYLDALTHPVHRYESQLIKLRRADILYSRGDHEAALKDFKAIYAKLQPTNTLFADSYYQLRLAELAVIADEFDLAREVLDKRVDYLFYAEETHLSVKVAILKGYLAVFDTKDLDEALRWSDKAHSLNGGQNYTYETDLLCRFFECSVYYLRGDFDVVKAVIARSVQMLRTRGIAIIRYPKAYYYLLIDAFLKHKVLGKTVKDKKIKYFSILSAPENGLWAKLLIHDREFTQVSFKKKPKVYRAKRDRLGSEE